MLDTRYDSVVYQSQVYVSALVDQLIVAKKKIGKEKDAQWAKVDRIYAYLEALQETPKLTDPTDITNITFILECLIVLCEIASFPIVPSLMWTGVPNLIVGQQGPPGTGIKGDTGATGFATDFMGANLTAPAIVDFFSLGNAKGARWDYVAVDSITGAQRASSIIGQWTPDGLQLELTDFGTEDLVDSTAGLEFDLIFSSSNIQLIAVVTSGQWTINGTRYYIPSNGNGSGPVSPVLSQNKILIGNASNLAQPQDVTGVISIDFTGTTTLNPGVITNNHVSASAGIDITKLAALTPNQIVITDSLGFLTTVASPTLTQLGYLDVSSSIQTQLNGKLSDPTTSIGDIIIRDGSNVLTRLPAGSPGQVLTLSGSVPSWQNAAAGFVDPMTTVGDIIIRNGGNVTSRLGIGLVNQVLGISGGVPAWVTLPGGISGLVSGILPKATSPTTIGNSIISESSGAILIAGTVEVQNGIKEVNGIFLKKKIIAIGDWNMVALASITVAHGLTISKIRSVLVEIRDDNDFNHLPINYATASNVVSGAHSTGIAFITLTRFAGGAFNNTSYDSTSYNRGYITIEYQA